jgi:hypothetical protein
MPNAPPSECSLPLGVMAAGAVVTGSVGKMAAPDQPEGADQERAQADATRERAHLRTERDEQGDEADRKREEGQHHEPAVLPVGVLTDEAPRRIEIGPDDVQDGEQHHESARARARKSCGPCRLLRG